MRRVVARLLWRALALLCLAIGLLGIVLPGLPGVVFLLIAAWAAGKGWPALEAWMLGHPRFGHNIRSWRENGAVPRRAKWLATLMMAASAAVLVLFTPLPLAAKIAIPALMAAVAAWLWRRPEI